MDEKLDWAQPTRRFTDRVSYYNRYRPGYPAELLSYLAGAIGLTADWTVADIGSGTGLLAALFVGHGNLVYAVEPNEAMRAAAEQRLSDFPNFQSVVATAEDTTLPESSVHFVTAGQAFHWFQVGPARDEFRRILRPNGWTALVYNSWTSSPAEVAIAYGHLVERYGTDDQVAERHKRLEGDINRFFGGEGPRVARFANHQVYGFDALHGRALSSSYAPLPDHAHYKPFLAGLRELFMDYAEDGRLLFPYETTVYLGRLQ